MTRRRSSKVHTERIVAPGLEGVEEFSVALAGEVAKRGVVAIARGVAETRELKDFIEESVSEANLNYPQNPPDLVNWFIHQYVVSLWVYVAVRQIAMNLAAIPIIAEHFVEGKWDADPNSPAQQIIDAPQLKFSTPELVERATTFLELAGSEVLVAERQHGEPMNPRGKIVGFFPLRPSFVTIIPGGLFAERYEYNINGTVIDIDPGNAELLRYVDPENDYWGLPPSSALTKTLQIEISVETSNLSLLKRGGVPELVLTTEQVLERGNARRTKKEFEQRYMRDGKTGGIAVLDAGLKLAPVGLPPKDMQYQDAAKMSQQRILSAYGVPPIMVMDLDAASKLANADAQVQLFYKFTLRQRARYFERAMTNLIQTDPRVGKGWRVRFAFEQVDALRDPDKEKENARKNYLSGLATKNEARKDLGLPPTVEGGDEFRAPADPNAANAFNEAPTKAKRSREKLLRLPPAIKAVHRANYARQFDLAFIRLRASMRRFFVGERDRVLRKFEGVRHRFESLPVAASFSVSKSIADETLVSQLFDSQEERAKFIAEVGPVYLIGLVGAGNEKMSQLDPSTKLALSESHNGIRDFYEKWGASRVVDINENTKDAIKRALQHGFDNGMSGFQIEEQIVSAFRDLAPGGEADADTLSDFPQYRLERIARTETQVMLNTGANEGVKELVAQGANIVKSWLSARDELVRDSHAQADAETSESPIQFGEMFSNGLMFPGDSSGDVGEVVNCFLPGTTVSGSFVGGVKSRYSGPAMKIRTVSGRTLLVTPNHPVLTSNGLVAASSIKNGAQLLCGGGNVERRVHRDIDHDQAPAMIEDVFETLSMHRGSRSSVVGALDLHGDAIHVVGQVDVVWANGKLRDEFRDQIAQLALVPPDPGHGELHGARANDSHGKRIALAAPTDMRRRDLLATLARGHLGPLGQFRLGPAADWNVVLSEDARQGGAAYFEFVGQILEAAAGSVALDKVVEVEEFNWSGHVFDLQSETGWILSNGILCSNCRCSLIESVLPEGE